MGEGRLGQDGDKGRLGPARTHPYLLGEAELAESDSVFDEQCKVLGLDQ